MSKEVEQIAGTESIFKIGRPIHSDGRGFFRELLRLKELPYPWKINSLTHHQVLPGREFKIQSTSDNQLVYPISGEAEINIPQSEENIRIDDSIRIGIFIPKGQTLTVRAQEIRETNVLVFSDTRIKNQNFEMEQKTHGLTAIRSQASETEFGSSRPVYDIEYTNDTLGTHFKPVQINHSRSLPGVIRGLHAEAWDKFIYPVTGNMVAGLVWIGSKDGFGDRQTINFSDTSRPAVFIPEGWANSICVLNNNTDNIPVDYIYSVGAYWTPDSVRSVHWNSAGIQWPVSEPIISQKDQETPALDEYFKQHFSSTS